MKASLIAIGRSDLTALARILSRVDRSDPYSCSAGYYALTGRNGLWFYGDDVTGMLIARHPNKADRLLFFPPFGIEPAALVQRALADPQLPLGTIQLARMAKEDWPVGASFGGIEKEPVLDWTYPVHILDVGAVNRAEGKGFRDFRKNLHRAERADFTSRILDMKQDRSAIMELAHMWAKDHKGAYSIEDLIDPTRAALDLVGVLSVAGIVVFENHRLAAFSLWEENRRAAGMANGLANLSVATAKGASEYLYREMCGVLAARGFKELCIGGSETLSLDAFKRKMQPLRSEPLWSIMNLVRSPAYKIVDGRVAA